MSPVGGIPACLDGRTCTRRYQLDAARTLAATTGHRLHVIECVCPDPIARARLTHAAHVAGNRDFALHQRLKAAAEPLPPPVLRIDTTAPPAACARHALDYLLSPVARTGEESTG
ncbi:hypothetical protein [Streptomyces jumonjinensis]|uniref:hypothetical protein n=1 Tax=Streptomyces jumonjinensis TaxID=1945 RepID=UPI00379BE465